MYALPTLLLFGLAQNPVPAQAAPQEDTIWDRLSIYANGRLRAESTFDQPSGEDRHRGRMRFRLGALYDLTETIRAEARVTTTSGEPNNPHWDFGAGSEGLNGSELALDRFFLKWKACENLSVQAGKFPHVFAGPPVFSELVWDEDVHPSGVAATWGPGKRDGTGYDLRAAGYVVDENGSDTDPTMAGLQGNLYFAAGEDTDLHFSSSLMNWSGLNGGGGVVGNQGNTDVTGEFLVWEGFAAAVIAGGPMEQMSGFAQVMHNLDDDDGEEDGFALGVILGKGGHEGDASVFAAYYDLDANAVFSPVAQDDTPIAGTGVGAGMEGVIAGGQYWVNDKLSLKLWGLSSDADAAEDPVRVRFDIDFKVL